MNVDPVLGGQGALGVGSVASQGLPPKAGKYGPLAGLALADRVAAGNTQLVKSPAVGVMPEDPMMALAQSIGGLNQTLATLQPGSSSASSSGEDFGGCEMDSLRLGRQAPEGLQWIKCIGLIGAQGPGRGPERREARFVLKRQKDLSRDVECASLSGNGPNKLKISPSSPAGTWELSLRAHKIGPSPGFPKIWGPWLMK